MISSWRAAGTSAVLNILTLPITFIFIFKVVAAAAAAVVVVVAFAAFAAFGGGGGRGVVIILFIIAAPGRCGPPAPGRSFIFTLSFCILL